MLLALALGSAAAGLLVDGVYGRPESTAAMLRGYDLVTLVLVVPALGCAVVTLRRASRTPVVAATSLAACLLYTDGYYLFGTGFNDLLLLHIGVFVSAAVTLVLGLREVGRADEGRLARRPARWAAGLIGGLTVALAGMWVWAVLDNALTGAVPVGSQLVETGTVVRLGIVLDLAVLVPFYAVAFVLLWRGTEWGFVLTTTAVASGLVHQVGYLVAMPMQVAAGVPGAVRSDPAEPVIVLLYVAAAVLLVRARGHSERDE